MRASLEAGVRILLGREGVEAMKATTILDLIEGIFASNYDTDQEISEDELEELLKAIEIELYGRDSSEM